METNEMIFPAEPRCFPFLFKLLKESLTTLKAAKLNLRRTPLIRNIRQDSERFRDSASQEACDQGNN